MLKNFLLGLAKKTAPIRVVGFLLTLVLFWLPFAIPIYTLVKDTNLQSLLSLPLLYIEFLFLLNFWAKNTENSAKFWRKYGLIGSRKNGLELISGLFIGVISNLLLFTLQGLLGWLTWQNNPDVGKVILEGILVALPLGFAEELLFRGWLLDELERDYKSPIPLVTNSLIFATVHFIKPLSEIIRNLPGFPGLFILALTLIWAKKGSEGRLGLSIGLHAGLVWGYYMINVGKLVTYSGQVPDWITGVDQNPLAGIMGLLFLGNLALLMKKRAFQCD
jgi:uncharacterized protein